MARKRVLLPICPGREHNITLQVPMNESGYNVFSKKVPINARVVFEASGLAYVVSEWLKSLGYNDLTVAHPRELMDRKV